MDMSGTEKQIRCGYWGIKGRFPNIATKTRYTANGSENTGDFSHPSKTILLPKICLIK